MAGRPSRGQTPKVAIYFVTFFLRVKIDARKWDMLGGLKAFGFFGYFRRFNVFALGVGGFFNAYDTHRFSHGFVVGQN